jgi:hypothetical protein
VRRDAGLARRGALRRAAAHAAAVAGLVDRLLEAEAAHATAASSRTIARHRTELRNTLTCLDEALAYGLDFDFVPPAELGHARAHARDTAFVVRLHMESGRPRAARQFAVELLDSILQIQRRVLGIEAETPPATWSATWSGRLLGLAAHALPRPQRRDFIEDQCGNLAAIESRREWAGYLLSLLVRMPEIAEACQ